MQWDYLFSNKILERGRLYYRLGRVEIVDAETNNLYFVSVQGSEKYHLILEMNENPPEMFCSCPYAAKGYRCKHMAAALYAIENSKSHSNKPERHRIFPFKKEESEDKPYRYFDMSAITSNLIFFDDICNEARQMIDRKEIMLGEFNTGYVKSDYDRTFGEMTAEACTSEKGYSCARIRFGPCDIYMFYCEGYRCPANYYSSYNPGKEYTPCVHEVALLFLINDYIEKENPGDFTDVNALKIINNFRKNNALEYIDSDDEIKKTVEIEPRIEEGPYRNQLRLSFKIGSSKLYILKDMRELVHCVENGSELTLGKSETLNFSTCTFNDKSEKYYNLIRRYVESEEDRLKRNIDALASDYPKRDMELVGRFLDDFFEIAEGSLVDIAGRNKWNISQQYYPEKRKNSRNSNGNTLKISIRTKDPEIHLSVEPDVKNNVFYGLIVRGNVPQLIRGANNKYYIEADSLTRISRELEEIISPFSDVEFDNDVLFRIGRKRLSEFYYSILPKLSENFSVEEPDAELIQKYIPPEVKFKFYLDAEDGEISCRALACYGDIQHALVECFKKGEYHAPKENYRDAYREESVSSVIREYLPWINVDGYFCCYEDDEDEDDKDAVYNLLHSGLTALMKLGEVNATDRFRRLNIKNRVAVSVGVSINSNIMDLEISSRDVSNEELLEILESYRLKRKYHRLKDGSFVSMDDSALKDLFSVTEALRLTPREFVKGKMRIPMYRALYLDKLLEDSKDLYATRSKRFKKLVRDFKTVEDSDFEVPSSLEDVMRTYQKFGFRWIRTLESNGFGGILADDMGLGKTLQLISVLEAEKSEASGTGEKHTSIIIVPASLVYNWVEEFTKFAPELSVCTVTGTQNERKKIIKQYEDYDVLVTSYDLLKRDIAEYDGITFDFQVIDEAQYIKNSSTAAAKTVKAIKSRARIALTGTPIENRLSELWSIFDFLMPGYLYGYETFRKEFETPIAKYDDDSAAQRLKKMVSPFILRRLKEDVLKDLPDKIEEIRYAKMEKDQEHVYDGQVVRMNDMLSGEDEESFKRDKIKILAELTRIRQICCDPALLFEDYKGSSAKRELCMEMIRNAIDGEHKILVFSQFTSMLEILELSLNKEKIAFYKITGATDKKERLSLVKKFNEDSVPVFLISLKAGGVGLNLTGADIVIHYDPWWNLAAQNQATDRAHRIGQTKIVSVYKLIAKGTIEENIVNMQQSKKDLADAILEGETGGIVGMSKDDLLELLK